MPSLVSGGTFTNNWKNILDKLRNILRNEFKGSLPVYIGDEGSEGSQFIRIEPTGSEILEYNISSESREFSITIYYYFAEHNLKKTALDHVLRYVSRIEALIHDNTSFTLADSSNLYNCRLETMELNPDEESGVYIAQWEWKGQHTGNIS
tara:strand:+ start:10189 stop:10638 length:450 start_codon:yes stop_codon:yes gene_type:complete